MYTNSRSELAPNGAKIFGLINDVNYEVFDLIREYNIEGVLYHKKIIIIDNNTVFFGSMNLTINSFENHDECAIIIDSPLASGIIGLDLNDDFENSNLVSNQDVDQSYGTQFFRRALTTFVRPLL